LAACGVGPAENFEPSVTGAVQPIDPEQQQALTGLPCDVKQVLQANCASCHTGSMYVPEFHSRADLMKPMHADGVSFGALAVQRMSDDRTPMPPAYVVQRPNETDRAVVANWVAAGMPGGSCGEL
jgi:hypothetical protein